MKEIVNALSLLLNQHLKITYFLYKVRIFPKAGTKRRYLNIPNEPAKSHFVVYH